ncbi:MAG: TetR/AcrR family transcriptional regulator [Myxococcota bacterium]
MKISPDSILVAAYACFARYGYKRVALEQIAQEAGISRAALYLHFRNKEAIFRALSRKLHDQMQAAAEQAAEPAGPLETRLEAILCAKLGHLFELISASPHAAEILDENSRLCGDVSEEFRKRFLRVLRGPIVDADAAGEIDLRACGLEPAEAAELLLDSAKGLERTGLAGAATRHRRRLAHLASVFAQGLRPAAKPVSPRARTRRRAASR